MSMLGQLPRLVQLSAVGGFKTRGRLPPLEDDVSGRARLHRQIEISEIVTSALVLLGEGFLIRTRECLHIA